jgi:hypothetical protein
MFRYISDEAYIENAKNDDLPEIREFTKLEVEDLRPGFYYFLKSDDITRSGANLYQYVVVEPDTNEPVFKLPEYESKDYFTINLNEDPYMMKLTKYNNEYFRPLQSPITIKNKIIYLESQKKRTTRTRTRSLKRHLKRSRTRHLKRSLKRSRARSRKRSVRRSSRH